MQQDIRQSAKKLFGPDGVRRAIGLGADGALDDGLVDLRAAFTTLWNRIWFVAVATLVAAAVGFVAVSLATPKFRSSAQLMLDPREYRVTGDNSVISDVEITEQIVATEIAVLRSNLMVEKVVDALVLDERPEFSDPNAVLSLRARIQRSIKAPFTWLFGGDTAASRLSDAQIIAAVQKKFAIAQVGISNAIEIRFESEDPEIAADAANALVDVYIAHRYDESIAATRSAAEWLAERTTRMADELKALERDEADKRAEALQANRGGREPVIAEAALMSEELASLRAVIIERTTLLERWRTMRASDGLLGVARMIDSESLDELRKQQSLKSLELAQAGRATGQDTTIYRRLSAELSEINRQLEIEADAQISALTDELLVLGAREAALQSYSEELTERLLQIDRSGIDIVQAERESAAARAVYEALLIRLNETRAQEALGNAGAKQIVFADVPSAHALPRRGLTMAAFALLGLALAMAFVFFREMRLDRFRSLAEIERATKTSVLAGLPIFKNRLFKSKEPWEVALNADFMDQMRRVRSRVYFETNEDQRDCLMITSSLPGEGKTETAVALAKLLSLSGGKVVLIDCDFINPRLTNTTDTSDHAGLCDLLRGEVGVEAAVARPQDLQFDMIPVGKDAAESRDLLSSVELQNLLATLIERYSYVLLDMPPVHASADAQTVGRVVDQTLVVVDYAATPRMALSFTLNELTRNSVDVTGLVANRVPQADLTNIAYS